MNRNLNAFELADAAFLQTKGVNGGLYEYGTTNDSVLDSSIEQYLEASTATFFGSYWGQDQSEGRLRQSWTGIMGYSSDGFPFIGSLPSQEDLYLAASF